MRRKKADKSQTTKLAMTVIAIVVVLALIAFAFVVSRGVGTIGQIAPAVAPALLA